MCDKSTKRTKAMLLAGFLASSIVFVTATAQERGADPRSSPLISRTSVANAPLLTPAATSSANRDVYFKRRWGVEIVGVRVVSSGSLIRFSYRVLDAGKAKDLNDKKLEPRLIDETTGVMLQIPVMEKVGQLRQTAAAENGRQYWMVFSNKGRYVNAGDRVDIVIGKFRVNGLVVEGLLNPVHPN